MARVVARYPLQQQPGAASDWRGRSPAERLDAVEALRQSGWAPKPMFAKDFKEFVASLHSHGVEYQVVGAYAMA